MWTYQTEGNVSSPPVVVYGVVFIGSGEKLYAVDAATGAMVGCQNIVI